MHLEYLIFNIIVISGPLLFGSFRPFYFLDRLRDALISAGIIAIPYIIWDALVTGTHWMFNSQYTLDFRIAHLPIEEWMFFITVPVACLFTWEMILRRSKNASTAFGKKLRSLIIILPVISIWFFLSGKEYTGLVFIFITLGIFLDMYFKTNLVLKKQFYVYMVLIIFFTLIFNGYLTWRPVVLYGESYQMGFRIFTIPIEDFGYGISFLFLVTIVYEKIKNASLKMVKKV